jgi:PAS domain-containing protein
MGPGAGFTQETLTDAVRDDKYIWGWKAISCLLNLSVSTVQLWEREGKLPVHRLRTGRRTLPYVLEREILAWTKERTVSLQAASKVDARLPLLMHSFLDAWPAHIAVLDATGTIVAVNKAWRAFSRSNGYSEDNLGIGRNYFEICGSAVRLDAVTASRVADGFAQFLAGGRPDLKVKYRCEHPAEKRDFLLTVARFEGLTAPFFVFCHFDVTNAL